jgi:phosphoglycerol transferase MdoB-like AlkP superfamily enzyme
MNWVRRLPLEFWLAASLVAIFWLPRFDLIFKMGWGRSVFQPVTWLHLILFDLTVLGYFLAPWLLLSLTPIKRKWQGSHWVFLSYLTFIIFLAFFACIAEFFFIDEFSSRYNFIAVDYLVYTSEVLKNVWESYHIVPITLAVALVSLGLAWLLKQSQQRLPARVKIGLLTLFALLFICVNEEGQIAGLTEPQKEVSKNSFHALFAAFRNNQIDYEKFYPTLPDTKAFEVTHEEMQKDFSQDQIAKGSIEDPKSVIRNLERPATANKKWNVMFVLMESMSAKYMRPYGGQGLTPNLDRLHEEGLTFDHVYSTGTRTVRGIEAVMLSLPPTPGQSIVRRPHSDNIFTIGSVLKDRGYDLSFVYGGHALFDNMGEFFEANSFSVFDQGDFDRKDVHFSNAWGICDEDVFDYAIRRANELQKDHKPFFQFILTTSNHRPYTFPENRVDMESGSSREAAVKYSDYSVGHFLDEAKKQPWYDQTLFVFVADHNAAVSGGTKVLPSDYRIPFIVYSPKIVPRKKISLLGSQIDVAPTLLGLLGISYQSRFYGHDLMTAKNERTFLGTYQQLAYMEKDRMMILEPPKRWAEFKLDGEKPTQVRSGTDFDLSDEMLKKTVGYYQSASDSFRHRLIGLEKQYPSSMNVRVFKKTDL